jgi:hypothetical protein
MLPRTLRRLGYAWLLLQGTLAALAPRVGLRLNLKPAAIAFENVGELEPREWYLRWVRAAGVGMLATGAAGLVLETAATDAAEYAVDEEDPVSDDADAHTGDGSDR